MDTIRVDDAKALAIDIGRATAKHFHQSAILAVEDLTDKFKVILREATADAWAKGFVAGQESM